MRIADLVAKHVTPGTLILDLTPEGSSLSPYLQLPASYRVTYERPDSAPEAMAPGTVLVHEANGAPPPLSAPVENTTQVFFAQQPEAFFGNGILEEASRLGWVLDGAHEVEHPTVHAAFVFRPDLKKSAAHRRAINEYRFRRMAMTRLRRDNMKLTADLAMARQAIEHAENTRNQQAARADRAARQLEVVQQKLRATRKSVGFRVGRATKVVAKDISKLKLKTIPRWISVFRDREPELLATLNARAEGAEAKSADVRTTELRHYLMGWATPPGTEPGVAGVVSARTAETFSGACRFWNLTPNGWRYQLDVASPAYVVVTSDALECQEAWGGFGVLGGYDGTAELCELARICHARRIPLVYWDIEGRQRARLGAPLGVNFLARFTVVLDMCRTDEGSGFLPLAQDGSLGDRLNDIALTLGVDPVTKAVVTEEVAS